MKKKTGKKMSVNSRAGLINIIDFKTDRQLREWGDPRLSEKLKSIIVLIAYYSWNFLNKRIMITEIYRTQGEQDEIYKDSEKYQKKPWQSVHQHYRGVDLRSYYFDEVEIKSILTIANTIPYDLNRPRKKTALYHSVGRGNHLHIQVCYEK